MGFPNFNFNVSHHGDYVAIASEPICLVGLDIVSYSRPENETIPDFIQHFSSYFSTSEWDKINNAGTCDQILNEFYRYGYKRMFSNDRVNSEFPFSFFIFSYSLPYGISIEPIWLPKSSRKGKKEIIEKAFKP